MARPRSPSSSASSHHHSRTPSSETLTPGLSGSSSPALQSACLSFYEDIERSRPHQVQLEHWREEEASYRTIVDSQEEILRIRQNELYQLLGMFAVFQGVIFSGVAQSSTLTCADVVTPISLSLTTAVVTFMAVLHKLFSICGMQHELSTNKECADAVYDMIENLKIEGSRFDLTKEPARSCRCRGYALSYYGMTLLSFLLFLSIGIMVSCVKLLCNECKCETQP